MRPLIFVVVSLVAGMLVGCVRFQSQPIKAENTAAEFQNRRLDAPGLKAFVEANLKTNLSVWPVRQWDFQKLTLAAFYYNSDLELARAHWAVVNAGKTTAGERPNPTLGVVPAYSANVSVPSPWLVTPTLDVPIETAGKRGHRIAQAGNLSTAARFNITTIAWQVRGKVRKSLLAIYQADETKRLLDAQQKLQEENVSLLERQYQAGAISSFELTQARLTRDAAKVALHDAIALSASARVDLADALGVPIGALEDVRFSATDFKLPAGVNFDQARRQALLNRADIRGALAEYEASQSALQLEIAKQFPDISLAPGYEYDQGNNKWSLGLTVTLPILNQNKGAIAEALAKRAESAANFNAVQAKVLAEIDRAWAAAQLAQQRHADADARLAIVQKQENLSQGMFEAGEIARADLTAQRLQLNTEALTRLEARLKSQQALGDLEDALQTSLELSQAAWENTPRTTSQPQ